MYAVVIRRKADPALRGQALARAQSEYFPDLQQAPGFVALYLVAGDDGTTNAINIWESRAQAEAFQGTMDAWGNTLTELGITEDSRVAGEVIHQLSAQK
jgi:hypothetical protein